MQTPEKPEPTRIPAEPRFTRETPEEKPPPRRLYAPKLRPGAGATFLEKPSDARLGSDGRPRAAARCLCRRPSSSTGRSGRQPKIAAGRRAGAPARDADGPLGRPGPRHCLSGDAGDLAGGAGQRRPAAEIRRQIAAVDLGVGRAVEPRRRSTGNVEAGVERAA